jgi:hypothetical protein
MAATPLCETPLTALKKSLRDEFPHVKSSHLSEALAYSLGYRTHASMNVCMVGPERDRPYILLNTRRFVERLMQFGYEDDPEFDFEITVAGNRELHGVVSTVPYSAYEIEYKSERQKAWRNLMVCAINAALEKKLFTLRPGDNRFSESARGGELFDFTLPNGLPARGAVSDAGFEEVSVHAAVNPTTDAVRAYSAGFQAGDAFGAVWLERERGAWMQTYDTSLNCRRWLTPQLAALDVEPLGYGDRGHVIM